MIRKYVDRTKRKTAEERIAEGREKTGVFTGLYCLNQLNGYKMPLYISDFVLMEFGTGAVVGVPGHDKRDFEFAKKFDIPVKRVVVGVDNDKSPINRIEQVQEEEGVMVESEFLNGMEIHKAVEKMMDYMEEKGWGKRVTTYRLRDWCISRQRYWGAPIPMVYCPSCVEKGIGWVSEGVRPSTNSRSDPDSAGWYPVLEEDLPVLLPDLSDWRPEGTGKGPLAKLKSWVKVKCPYCGGEADRETDVCDTFLDSSWYHLRYPSVGAENSKSEYRNPKHVQNSKSKTSENNFESRASNFVLGWDRQITRGWLPVDQYIGGAEHTVLHLLYARFIWMAFCDWGMIPKNTKDGTVLPDEPYSRFFAHGLIIKDGAKMSKSRGNVVVPDIYIQKYGADTLRTYLMFLGPFDAGGDFRDTGIAGMYKFLSRVWRLVNEYIKVPREDEVPRVPRGIQNSLERNMHKTIKGVTEDISKFHYNTAIAKIMEYVNEISKVKSQKSKVISDEAIKILLLLLAPFAPFMTEELYQKYYQMGSKSFKSIHLEAWPEYDQKCLIDEFVTIVVQVNGKTREVLKVKSQKSKVKNDVEFVARESEKVRKYLEGKKIKNIVFVPGKLINFVV